MAVLTDPVAVGSLEPSNRLYRALPLECGNGPEAVNRLIAELEPIAELGLIAELEPTAAAGAGLICRGPTVVHGEGGCVAPGTTHVHDSAFVDRLSRRTDWERVRCRDGPPVVLDGRDGLDLSGAPHRVHTLGNGRRD